MLGETVSNIGMAKLGKNLSPLLKSLKPVILILEIENFFCLLQRTLDRGLSKGIIHISQKKKKNSSFMLHISLLSSLLNIIYTWDQMPVPVPVPFDFLFLYISQFRYDLNCVLYNGLKITLDLFRLAITK